MIIIDKLLFVAVILLVLFIFFVTLRYFNVRSEKKQLILKQAFMSQCEGTYFTRYVPEKKQICQVSESNNTRKFREESIRKQPVIRQAQISKQALALPHEGVYFSRYVPEKKHASQVVACKSTNNRFSLSTFKFAMSGVFIVIFILGIAFNLYQLSS